jgi:hypothetical protein
MYVILFISHIEPSIILIFLLQHTSPSNDDVEIGDHGSLLHSAERLLAPIQPPLPAGTPVREQPTGGFTSTFNSANPTFAVLKATALQQALGHPMAYARVLMQVKYS